MKHGSHFLTRHALGRQSISVERLLMIPLLLALVQPIASQDYVYFSSYDGSTKTPALEQADETQESLRPSHPEGWTEAPDHIMVSRAKTEGVADRNVQAEAVNNAVQEMSTNPSKMNFDLTVHSLSPNNRTKGAHSQSQRSTVRPVTTMLTHKIEGYPEQETTTVLRVKQDSSGTTIAEEASMLKKTVTDTNKEGRSMSAVFLPTAITLEKSSTKSNDADQAQTSHTFLTTEATSRVKPTFGLVLQDKASAATLTSKKPSTSVHSPVVADEMNTSGADREGE